MIKTALSLLAAGASKINPSDIGLKNPTKDPNTALTGLLTIAYTAAGIICVIIIIIAGFIYITSNGDASSVKRAKEAIFGAVAGLIVVILAFTITQFVLGRV